MAKNDTAQKKSGFLLREVIDSASIGLVVVDLYHKILDYNHCFRKFVDSSFCDPTGSLFGLDFYQVIGEPFFFDGDFAPFYFATTENRSTTALVGLIEDRSPANPIACYTTKSSACESFFSFTTTPIHISDYDDVVFLVELKDISEASEQTRRLETLKTAGMELTEITDRYKDERQRTKELKKAIEKHIQNILNYDVVEIRILKNDSHSHEGQLKPFWYFNLSQHDAQRVLYVKSNDNGVSGYVADSGEPYICDDTENDAHYIKLSSDYPSKSSLTVPLVFANKVIGVCNVESRVPHAFSKKDETFLILYANALAQAIHLHQSLSTKLTEVRSKFGSQIAQLSMDVEVNKLLDQSLTSRATIRNSFPPKELQNEITELSVASFTLERKMFELKRLLKVDKFPQTRDLSLDYFPEPWQQVIDDYRDIVSYLDRKMVLSVAIQERPRYVEQLEVLGCRVVELHSTKSAIQALKLESFDIVITDINPDGQYFSECVSVVTSQNQYGCSIYDIHEDGYFEPVSNDLNDIKERKRIYKEIHEDEKLDAFFFLRVIDSLHLSMKPLFIVNSPIWLLRDKTHTVKSINEYIEVTYKIKGVELPNFTVKPDTPEPLLHAIKKALTNRNTTNKW